MEKKQNTNKKKREKKREADGGEARDRAGGRS